MSNTRSKGDFLFRGHNRLVELAQTRPPVPAWEQALRQFGARFFEAAPGLVTWILLLAPAWIPIIFHSTGALFVASVVLVFDAYWVLLSAGVCVPSRTASTEVVPAFRSRIQPALG